MFTDIIVWLATEFVIVIIVGLCMQVEAFFDVHADCGSIPGGLHLEMTGDDVTECIGGGSGVTGDWHSPAQHSIK